LRAVRFRATLNFDYHIDTRSALAEHAALTTKVSMERVRDELNKMLADASAGTALDDLQEFGFLQQLMPELQPLNADFFHAVEDDIATLETRWTALLCHLKDPFDAPALIRRFRLPGAQASQIEWLLRHQPLEAEILDWTLGARRRLLLHSNFPLLWETWRMAGIDSARLAEIRHEWQALREHFEAVPKALLTGTEIMELTGKKAGPEIGQIQNELLMLQLEHKIKNRAEAETWAQKH
jgi:tRNA nucleotidyltransferase/poly(A) polymerase